MGKKQVKLERQAERRRQVRKKILARRSAMREEAKKAREKKLLEHNVNKAVNKAEKAMSPELQKTLELLKKLENDKDGTDSVVLPNQTMTLKHTSKDTNSSEDEVI